MWLKNRAMLTDAWNISWFGAISGEWLSSCRQTAQELLSAPGFALLGQTLLLHRVLEQFDEFGVHIHDKIFCRSRLMFKNQRIDKNIVRFVFFFSIIHWEASFHYPCDLHMVKLQLWYSVFKPPSATRRTF